MYSEPAPTACIVAGPQFHQRAFLGQPVESLFQFRAILTLQAQLPDQLFVRGSAMGQPSDAVEQTSVGQLLGHNVNYRRPTAYSPGRTPILHESCRRLNCQQLQVVCEETAETGNKGHSPMPLLSQYVNQLAAVIVPLLSPAIVGAASSRSSARSI